MEFCLRLAIACVALFGLFNAEPARADHDASFEIFSHSCMLASETPIAFEAAKRSDRWNCSPDFRKADSSHIWLRTQVPQGADPALALRGMAAPVDRLTVVVEGSNGVTSRTVLTESDLRRHWTPGNYFAVPMPTDIVPGSTVYIELRDPLTRLVATELSIEPAERAASQRVSRTFLYAVCIGMLGIAALLSGVIAYLMRSGSAALHAVFSIGSCVYVLSASSLIFLLFPDLSLWARQQLSYAVLGIGVMLVGPMLYLHLEKGMVSRGQKVALAIGTIGSAFAAIALPLGEWMGFNARTVFHLAFIPFIVALLWVIGSSFWRGSRAIRGFALAWAAPIALGIERVLRGSDLYFAPMWLDYLFFFGLALQGTIMTVAIAYHTETMRKDRDRERAAALVAMESAMTDPLTRLPNRRDFEQFDWDAADYLGFVDIDRFKGINDTYGHDCGDDVLRAMAEALSPDAGSGLVRTWRLGGEEFAVALQAPSIEAAAIAFNRVRGRIGAHVARSLPHMTARVTASAGIVPAGEEPRQAYRAADIALYRAKTSGRNRLCYESESGDLATMFPSHVDSENSPQAA